MINHIWGTPIVQSETIANPFRYSGEWVEEKTNLQYLKARWYEAKLGRFISEDPVEGIFTEPLSLNRYTYAENNPLKYVDPTGNIVNVGLSFASTLTPELTGGSAAAKAVVKGTEKARQLGKEGETLAGFTQQKERITSLTNSAKYRVPDELLRGEKILREIKNVSNQS